MAEAVCEVGEGPHWDRAARRWSWVDNANGRLFVRDGGHTALIRPQVDVVAAVPRQAGGWLLAAYDGLYDFDGEDATARPGPALSGTRFNDGACDAHGRFWVGTMSLTGQAGQGVLYRVTDDMTAMAGGFDVCNGLGFSPDDRWLYIVDTGPRLIYRYAFDLKAGVIGEREAWFQFPAGMGKPDGLAVDAEGDVWCAMWDGACLARVTSEGTLRETIGMPVPRPTSLAFGDNEILVTTARKGLSEDQLHDFPLSGQPLWLPTAVTGARRYAFAF